MTARTHLWYLVIARKAEMRVTLSPPQGRHGRHLLLGAELTEDWDMDVTQLS